MAHVKHFGRFVFIKIVVVVLLQGCSAHLRKFTPTTTLANVDELISEHKMTTARAAHTATKLPNGQVLLTGGFADGEVALGNAELFDPEARAFSPVTDMTAARQSHTATLLPDGKVLIAGGYNGDYLDSAELYNRATNRFSPTGAMLTARSGQVAVLLQDGKVLLAGGTGVGWHFLDSAEIYDPVSRTFSPSGNMGAPRESHTATLLHNGQVLITGGHGGRRADMTVYASAELYDPASKRFAPTGSMQVKRHKHDATLLVDGRVLITGGADERDRQGAYRSTEIYDPATGVFTLAASMHAARYKHTGTSLLLDNGQVLLVGGASTGEIYEPQKDAFSEIKSSPGITRFFATATLLTNGEVLLAGGYGTNIASDAQAWLFRP